MQRMKRAKKGAGKSPRINVTLAPDSIAELRRRASEEGRSDSAMAAILIESGLSKTIEPPRETGREVT